MIKTLTLFLGILFLNAACGNDKKTETVTSPTPQQDTLLQSEQIDTVAPPTAPPPRHEDKISEPIKDRPRNGAGSGAGAGRGTIGPKTSAPAPAKPPASSDNTSVSKSGFSDVAALDPSIKLDIRYATADNFTKSKIYDCPRCLLRPDAAKALVKAHKALQRKGFGLKMFDCYRPRPYQQRLWDKVPNPDYVTPPAKGSMHSRGAAVDLTVVDKNGKELDMGTPYDFFGKEAHTDNMNLPAQVLANRRLLRDALEAVGFKGIRTEWWHFSFQGKNYPLSDYVWPCEKQK